MKSYQLNERPFDGLTVGKFINKVLTDDQSPFQEIFRGKIFPALAVSNTTFPFLTYDRQTMTPYYSKDGCYQDEVQVEISVKHSDYEECLLLICGLRDYLECKSFPEYNVEDIQVVSAYEGMSDDGFEQKLNLKIIFI